MTLMPRNRMKGCLYGKAIGDALGIPFEYRSRNLIARTTPPGPIRYQRTTRRHGTWELGEWSDDTEMALAILEAANDQGNPEPTKVAENFQKWLGKDGRGSGSHTRMVIAHPLFLVDPIQAAEDVWDIGGRVAASNGAVMRSAVTSFFRGNTVECADMCAQVTHADPRARSAAVAIALVVEALIHTPHLSATEIIDRVQERVLYLYSSLPEETVPTAAEEIVQWMRDLPLRRLALDEGMGDDAAGPRSNPGAKIGYCWKAAAAGLWALRQTDELREFLPERDIFTTVIESIIREGGDTDTNAAVAGAILGAKYGYDALPRHLVEGLANKERLDAALKNL